MVMTDPPLTVFNGGFLLYIIPYYIKHKNHTRYGVKIGVFIKM